MLMFWISELLQFIQRGTWMHLIEWHDIFYSQMYQNLMVAPEEKVRGSQKSSGFILWEPQMLKQNVVPIRPVYVHFEWPAVHTSRESEVSRINGNPSNSCLDISVWPKVVDWPTDWQTNMLLALLKKTLLDLVKKARSAPLQQVTERPVIQTHPASS